MVAERQKKIICTILVWIAAVGAIAGHYLLGSWGFYRKTPSEEAALRMQVVETAQGWLGTKESDGSHKAIIDRYNAHEPLAVGYTMQYTDSWCSAFVSTVAIQRGLTEIIPTECGCQRHIGLFQALGRWEEDEEHIPNPGDLIFYDWDETERGDCTGWADHVGIVVGTKWPFLKVIEGNCDDQVKERVILFHDKTIRGYGLPDYASMIP